jgi:hypothetical protein
MVVTIDLTDLTALSDRTDLTASAEWSISEATKSRRQIGSLGTASGRQSLRIANCELASSLIVLTRMAHGEIEA